jgi:hypothetical protein
MPRFLASSARGASLRIGELGISVPRMEILGISNQIKLFTIENIAI